MRIGIPLIGSQGWHGGVVYVHNALRALRATRGTTFTAFLIADDQTILTLPEHQDILSEGLVDGFIHVGARNVAGGNGFSCRTVPTWEGLHPLVDVVYPGGWAPYFADHAVCWIPDFQYRHLPQFFPAADLAYRRQHDAVIAQQAKRVVFSSQDAERDFCAMFPDSRAAREIVHFHSLMPPASFEGDAGAVARRYGCAPEYLICSNQFWTHKNHRVLFAAIRLLWDRGHRLQLVCTGGAADNRDSGYYESLIQELQTWNTNDQVRLLGLIPRADQVQLMRNARAVIQPSLFEGWSTVVEDARSLGVPIFLSDIGVHREQAPPHAWYFPAGDPTALADLIQRQHPGLPAPGPARDAAGQQHAEGLVRGFGERLWEVLDRARSNRPLIATSIAPKKLDLQKRAIASWLAQGFDVVSINVTEEIQELTPHFPEVTFHASRRDGRALAGKPLVPLDEVLRVLREYNRPLSGIVNSDIVLTPLKVRRLSEVMRETAGDGLTFIKRMDQESDEDPGICYDGGIDAFFFGRGLLFAYPKTTFYLGLPWWDYFFTAYPLLAGYPINELREPVAFHRAHPSFYDVQRHWVPLAIDTLEFLWPLFANKAEIFHSSGLDTAVASVRRVTSSPPREDLPVALEWAFTHFARAMVHMIREGTSNALDRDRPAAIAPLKNGLGPSAGPTRRVRLGIPIFAGADWMGGVQMVVNLVSALSRLPALERPEVSLVVRKGLKDALPDHQEALRAVDRVILVGFADDGIKHRNVLSVDTLDEVFQHIDLLYPAHLMAVPGKPAATWIPDFQHLHLPTMFHPNECKMRSDIFQDLAEKSELLVLSSHAARRDWQRFYPNARPTVRVLPFRSAPDPAWFNLDPAEVAAKHGIGEPFLLCSNQFWMHKGHWTLIQAVAKLAQRGLRPLIVCTGALTDYRTESFVDLLRSKMSEFGVSAQFRILGVLPRAEQIALMRRSLAVVQPSLFEGWSTMVEDVRFLSKNVVLSDLDVHQEQDPLHGHYFRAGDVDDLTRILAEVLPTLRPGPALEDEQRARAEVDALVLQYARNVCALAREATALFRHNETAPQITESPAPADNPAALSAPKLETSPTTHQTPAHTIDLATTAAHRILAWPRTDRPGDLAALFRNFAPSFGKRSDVCLCLRHDPSQDGPDAVNLITAEIRRVFGDDARFEVLVVDDALDAAGWEQLGRAITAVLMLPWSWEGERHQRLSATGRPVLTSVGELEATLGGKPALTEAVTTPAPAPAPAPSLAAAVGEPATETPAVSIIVPTAGDIARLNRALDSLAGHTFGDFEVIVVNDGGQTVEKALEAYAGKLSITYVRTGIARGSGAARNAGLALARGRQVAFLDDDSNILTQVPLLHSNTVDVAPLTASPSRYAQ